MGFSAQSTSIIWFSVTPFAISFDFIALPTLSFFTVNTAALHSVNAPLPIEVSSVHFEKSKFVTLLHWKKALSPIFSRFAGKTTVPLISLQTKKANSSIVLRFTGKINCVKPVHSKNARTSIVVRSVQEERSTAVNFVQPEKAPLPISVRSAGNLNDGIVRALHTSFVYPLS